MHTQVNPDIMRAASLAAIAHQGPLSLVPADIAIGAQGHTHAGPGLTARAVASVRHWARKAAPYARLALWYARHPRQAWELAKTCAYAGKFLLTIWRALPWYVLPVLALAAVIKFCVWPDMGLDETLCAVAVAIIANRRPGLIKALYREAQNGKPAPCTCEPCAGKQARRVARRARVRSVYAWALAR
jgi:hypothetical protein